MMPNAAELDFARSILAQRGFARDGSLMIEEFNEIYIHDDGRHALIGLDNRDAVCIAMFGDGAAFNRCAVEVVADFGSADLESERVA